MIPSSSPLFILFLAILVVDAYRNFQNRNTFNKRSLSLSLFDNSIDLSNGQAKIIKKIVRPGDHLKGSPNIKDTVEFKWELRFLNGTIIGSSALYEEANEELYSARLGIEPPEVMQGWETVLYSMYEGEIANIYLDSEYAFGEKGLGEIVPSHTNIECTLELCSIIPALTKQFKSVGINESISEDLVEQIQAGESPISEDYMKNAPTRNPEKNETANIENAKFFDEKVHKIDPNQRVGGSSRGHIWEETSTELDVELAIPESTTKYDLIIDIKATSLFVKLLSGEVLLEGPLHGKIDPSDSHWAVLEADPTATIRSRRLQLSLRKGYGHREIWATVLDRKYLQETLPPSTPATSEE